MMTHKSDDDQSAGRSGSPAGEPGDRTYPDQVLAAFDAFYELAARLSQVMEQGLVERGLTSSRAELLLRLYERGPMVQRELSQLLRCTPRHVTALVDQMEATELAVRTPHPSDRRATLVELTDNGRQLAERLFAERQEAARQALGDVPASDLATAETVVRRFLDRLEPE